MKLINLFESEMTAEEIAQLIRKDCAKWLEESGGYEFYRGIKNWPNPSGAKHIASDVLEISVRKDRKPKDSSNRLHTVLDNYFEKETGIKYRSQAVFVTHSKSLAAYYGEMCLIFPIGNYHYAWSEKIEDALCFEDMSLYRFKKVFGKIPEKTIIDIAEKLSPEIMEKIQDEPDKIKYMVLLFEPSEMIELVNELLPLANPYMFDSGLNGAHSEVMVSCDKYYAIKVNSSTYDNLINELRNTK